jgi:O-antigen/teichoic acid export membrane protein
LYTELIKEGITLGGVVFLWLIYFRIDSVMLGYMRGDVEVGVYNVAYKIMEGIFFIPSMIMLVFYPKLVKSAMFEDIFRKLLVILGVIGVISSLLLYVLSSGIINLIYGPNFIGSIPVLRTLSLVLLPVFLGHLITQSLVALDMNRAYLLVAFIGVLINISLNFVLIPSFGANGAAWATLITEAIIVLFCAYFVWRRKPAALNYRSFDFSIRALLSNLAND